jgi:hypothetical protein
VRLSRFKSITSQNPSRSRPIHSNPHGSRITEQGLKRRPEVVLDHALLAALCTCHGHGRGNVGPSKNERLSVTETENTAPILHREFPKRDGNGRADSLPTSLISATARGRPPRCCSAEIEMCDKLKGIIGTAHNEKRTQPRASQAQITSMWGKKKGRQQRAGGGNEMLRFFLLIRGLKSRMLVTRSRY